MASNVHRHLLPHAPDPGVATALFIGADFGFDNDTLTIDSSLESVADGISRDAGWIKAATEAANTHDPARLDRLSRYGQKRVRRAVAANRHTERDTLAYLIGWAIDKSDGDTLTAISRNQPVGKILDAAGDRLRAAVGKGLNLSEMAATAVVDGPVVDLVRLYTDERVPRAAEHVIERFDRIHHSYGRHEDRNPAFGFDQLYERCGLPHPALSHTLWQVKHVTLGLARVMAQVPHPSPKHSVGMMRFSNCDTDAAVLLVEQCADSPHALRAALAARQPLPEATYDAVLTALEGGPEPVQDARFPLLGVLSANHRSHLTGPQLDRLVAVVDDLASSDGPHDGHRQLYDAVFREGGHLVSAGTATRLADTVAPDLVCTWVQNATIDGDPAGLSELRRPLDPQLLATLVARMADSGKADWKWLGDLLERLSEHPELADAAMDAVGAALMTMTANPRIAGGVAGRFTREFDGNVEAWTTAIGLMDGWEGTLSGLVEAAHALSGGRPQPPVEPVPGPSLAGQQLGLFG